MRFRIDAEKLRFDSHSLSGEKRGICRIINLNGWSSNRLVNAAQTLLIARERDITHAARRVSLDDNELRVKERKRMKKRFRSSTPID
ncbi:MAG: hypothetical protein ABW162_00815 [Candidatus Sedimenticola sp. PURPLELP]